MGRWIILVIEGKIDFAEPSLREHNQPGNGMPSDSDVINQILRTSLSSWRLQCKNHAIKRAQCSELGITAHSSSHPLPTNALDRGRPRGLHISTPIRFIHIDTDDDENLMNGFDRQK